MEEEKIGFFKRIKKAIFNFEEYSKFADEKLSKSFGYIFKIIIIITIIISACTTYRTYKIAEETVEIFKNNAPDFSIENGILKIENDEIFSYIDEDGYFGIKIDPTQENIDNFEFEEGIAFLKNKIYMLASGQKNTINYTDILEGDNLAKSDIENILTTKNLIKLYAVLGVILLITNFIVYTCVIFIDILILLIIGIITNLIAKTNLKYSSIFKISVYSITLPAILLTIYSVVTIFTSFTIKYFNLAYDLISYIYVITAIFIIKSDLTKNKQEVGTIENIQEKKKKEEKEEEVEIPEEKKEKKENKKEKKEKKENPGEPEGSNA